MRTITFDESTKKIVLAVFNKDVDAEGYIIDIETKQRVLSPDGNEVLAKDFAGIRKGSEIMVRKDLPSLLKYAGDIRN